MEVTIAAGVVGLVSLGTMRIMSNMSKTTKSTSQSLEITTWLNEIRGFLGNGENCILNFNDNRPDQTSSALPIMRGTTEKYTTEQMRHSVKIQSMTFGGGTVPIGGSPSFVETNLEIVFEKQGKPIGAKVKRENIKIVGKLSGNFFESCSAVSGAGTGFWIEDASGIHYKGGNVGIMEDLPGYPLHVVGGIKGTSLTANDIDAIDLVASNSMKLDGNDVATTDKIWGSLSDAQTALIVSKINDGATSNEKTIADAIVLMALNNLTVDSSACTAGQKVTGVTYDEASGVFVFACEDELDPCTLFGSSSDGDPTNLKCQAINFAGNITTTGSLSAGVTTLGATTASSIESTSTITATTSISTTSDRLLKKEIETITNALEKITALRGVHYKWKQPQKNNKNQVMTGFIAQEVQDVAPELVVSSSKNLSVIYDRVAPYLVEAIKELKQEITTLKEEIDILKENKQQ